MKKRRIVLILVFAAAFGCRFRDVNIMPDAPGQHRVVGLKFSFKAREGKQTGKIIWKYREDYTALIVLSPLNQPVAEAFTAGEEMTLVNKKKRMYWQGSFRDFLRFYWQLEFSLEEINKLLWEGIIPVTTEIDQKIKVEFAKDKGVVKKITITHHADVLTISMTKREMRKGNFSYHPDLGKLAPVALEEIFSE